MSGASIRPRHDDSAVPAALGAGDQHVAQENPVRVGQAVARQHRDKLGGRDARDLAGLPNLPAVAPENLDSHVSHARGVAPATPARNSNKIGNPMNPATPPNVVSPLIAAGFDPSRLIPVAPPTGPGLDALRPGSAGKVPARLEGDTWQPLADWRNGVTAEWLQHCGAAGGNVGLVLGREPDGRPGGYLALDLDFEPGQERLRNLAVAVATRWLADEVAEAPAVRSTAPHRALLLFRLEPGEAAGGKAIYDLGAAGKLELLAEGQQAVIGGTHHSGNPIAWAGQPAPSHVPVILGREVVDDLAEAILAALAREGVAVVSRVSASPSGDTGRNAASLAPPSADVVVSLLDGLPNPASVGRDVYLKVLLGAKGCIMGLRAAGKLGDDDAERIGDAAVGWAARWPDSPGAEVEREKWADDISRRDAPLAGWHSLESVACALIPEYRLYQAQAEFGPCDADAPDAPLAAPGGRPIIRVKGDNLGAQIAAAEDALIRAGLDVYQQGGRLVQVARVRGQEAHGEAAPYAVVEVCEVRLWELFSTVADWQRYDGRAKTDVSIRCPREVAAHFHARRGVRWRLPALAGLIHAPTLRADGSVLEAPGYDPATGFYLDPRGTTFPPVPANPSRDDAMRAAETLRGLLAEFPFVDGASRAVALSAILTATIRRSLGAAPLHAFTAPAPGTGKSFLTELVGEIAFARSIGGAAYSDDESENRKQIDGVLLAGQPAILLDNVTTALQGARLNEMLTQPSVTVRPLGGSRMVEVPCGAMVLATGNNISIAADMTRRCLLATLDAHAERPELRRFKADPIALVRANRGRYVAAALTILRAYEVAGRPNAPAPLGSFADWSSRVRAAIIWCGEVDPVATQTGIRENDPDRCDAEAVFGAWAATIGNRAVGARDLIDAALLNADLREALLTVAGVGGAVNSRRLGLWLRGNRGRVLGGLTLRPGAKQIAGRSWWLDGAPHRAAEFDDAEAPPLRALVN